MQPIDNVEGTGGCKTTSKGDQRSTRRETVVVYGLSEDFHKDLVGLYGFENACSLTTKSLDGQGMRRMDQFPKDNVKLG
jgi:hypothetical protein